MASGADMPCLALSWLALLSLLTFNFTGATERSLGIDN
jgi:hypothetical protein